MVKFALVALFAVLTLGPHCSCFRCMHPPPPTPSPDKKRCSRLLGQSLTQSYTAEYSLAQKRLFERWPELRKIAINNFMCVCYNIPQTSGKGNSSTSTSSTINATKDASGRQSQNKSWTPSNNKTKDLEALLDFQVSLLNTG
ncbi:uncharacterized protein [Epargyreus clarus]|uniref:uncharacterized protein n=1 Tax=Epargyreus clarus TaxID=520877 RepID=UPI003C30C75D